MGILNLTPDSFSDGGKCRTPEAAFQQASRLIQEGADLLDLGAESTRPGAKAVPAKEELKRLLPVLKRIRKRSKIPISIDTTKLDVAKECLAEGADIVNDVSALKRSGLAMAELVQKTGAGLVLMHSRGTPKDMQKLIQYQDVAGEILSELRESIDQALKAGVEHDQIVIDPGLGFAKTSGQNLELIRNLNFFHELGYPVLVGPSRKSFIGEVTGRKVHEREFGTAACVAAAVLQGAQILRVHEVGAMRDVIRMIEAIKGETYVRTF